MRIKMHVGESRRKEIKMEKYEKPIMEIVELINEVTLTSVCGTPDTNEAPMFADSNLCPTHCTDKF